MPHHSADLKDLLTHRHVLLLQGKMGSFFSRFATFLHKHDINVTKVNFNAGDAYFYKHPQTHEFLGKNTELANWLDSLITQKKIDAVVCFGDCRPHHLIARELLKSKDIPLYVFEEGYLRPYYITLEKHGVNGFSRIKLNKDKTDNKSTAPNLTKHAATEDQPIKVKNNFAYMSWIIIVYYAICWMGRRRFPHYRHYRNMSIWQEAGTWLRAPYFRLLEKRKDKKLQTHLTQTYSEQYFLVTLQVYNDFQITHHSDYDDVINFIDEVIYSFSEHANQSHHLVLKHHPMDRGQRHYGSLIQQLADKYGVAGRIHYGCYMHLPTMIKHSIGMVTINSTTGLQSIYHQKPVIAMCDAVYNQSGLTAHCSLKEFWKNPPAIAYENYLIFREQLIQTCQLNGAFYSNNPWMDVIHKPSKKEDKQSRSFSSDTLGCSSTSESITSAPHKTEKNAIPSHSEFDESAA